MRILCTAILAALIPGVAHADWQFTKWGMTPAQVVEASSGAAHMLDASEVKRLTSASSKGLVGIPSYQSGGMTFAASFYFDDAGRLCMVKLRQRTGVDGLVMALESKYGVPVREWFSGVREWWSPDGDRVQFDPTLGPTVYYRPISATGNGDGL